MGTDNTIQFTDIDKYLTWMERQVAALYSAQPYEGLYQAATLQATHLTMTGRIIVMLVSKNVSNAEIATMNAKLMDVTGAIGDAQVLLTLQLVQDANTL